ncbi:hypothetical protein JD292_00265 [Leucobacter sp. CSA2]|uniref:Bacterial repeat domain-containing protein n=1 Tax=Leucobacter edaphi TaxID=2796472 RepID=A0A934QAX0_9MICO|nr:hypothetical protein [Leucobacter edaphi]MBK0420520.1 hypothetical protein [Leucobacter edaphi]
MNHSTVSGAKSRRSGRISRFARAALAIALAIGGAGIAVAGTSSAAQAAPGDPNLPYNITFVWKLGPGASADNPFASPQTLVTSGSDANNPNFMPAFDYECGFTYQMDRYRIETAEDQALVDEYRTSKTLTKATDVRVGMQWEALYRAQFDTRYFSFDETHQTCGAKPVAPAVTQAVCTAPGQSTLPTVTPAKTEGIDYAVTGDVVAGGTVTVTATPQANYTLEDADGWTKNSDGTATQTITLDKVDCTENAVPVVPEVTQAECAAPGQSTTPTVKVPSTPGIDYEIDGTPAAGGTTVEVKTGSTITVTATAKDGYRLGDAPGWTRTATGATTTVKTTTPDCNEAVTPVLPKVTGAECVPGGDIKAPTVTLVKTTGITYTLNGTPKAGGQVTITAAPEKGYTLGNAEKFEPQADGTAVATVSFGTPQCAQTPPAKPSTPTGKGELAVTGANDFGPAGIGAIALLVGGAAAIALSRRKAVKA